MCHGGDLLRPVDWRLDLLRPVFGALFFVFLGAFFFGVLYFFFSFVCVFRPPPLASTGHV